MKIGWLFPKKTDGGFDGFNNSGPAHFAGTKFPSLVREIIQNSLDAHDPKAGKPVRVEFDMEEIDAKKFPDLPQLLKVFEQCCEQLKTLKDEKAKNFFARGLDILKGRKIRMLKVSDFNTTGLHGEGKDSLFYILTKASGISSKPRPDAGGSHGLGKNAPYLLSRLHTVFYSTMYQEGTRTVVKAQGRSVLMSHGDDGSTTQGIGYYGETQGCSPMLDDSVPDFLKRKEQGTTVFVAGFEESPKWEDSVLASVLSSFFAAIDDKQLSVSIGNNLTVDAESLRRNFDDMLTKYPGDKDFEDVRLGYHLYDALKYGEERDMQLRHGIGHCKLKVLVGEGLPKQVGLIRNTGMMITAYQPGLRLFRGIGDFVAVCTCDNDAGNRLLRDMENPRHDAFEADWLEDKAEDGKKALNELTDTIRRRINSIILPAESDSVPIDEMGDFFSGEVGDNGKGKSEDRDFEQGVVITRGRPPLPKRKKKRPQPTPPQPNPYDPVPQPTHKRTPIDIVNIRIVDGEGERERVAYFTPSESGKASLDFWIVGDSWDDQLQLTEKTASKAQSVNLVKGKRTAFRFVAAHDVRGAMRVFAYKNIDRDEGK